jgi:hypothetical protein
LSPNGKDKGSQKIIKKKNEFKERKLEWSIMVGYYNNKPIKMADSNYKGKII